MIEMDNGVRKLDVITLGIVGMLFLFSPVGLALYYAQPLFLLLLIITFPVGVRVIGWVVGLVEKLNGREVK